MKALKKFIVSIYLLFVLLVGCTSSDQQEKSINEQYPLPWRESNNEEL